MIHRLPLVEMASLARSGAVSSFELVEAHLARIEAVNPHFNAFTMVLADQARASARRADQGLKMGPLHGVPVSINCSTSRRGTKREKVSATVRIVETDRPSSSISRIVERTGGPVAGSNR